MMKGTKFVTFLAARHWNDPPAHLGLADPFSWLYCLEQSLQVSRAGDVWQTQLPRASFPVKGLAFASLAARFERACHEKRSDRVAKRRGLRAAWWRRDGFSCAFPSRAAEPPSSVSRGKCKACKPFVGFVRRCLESDSHSRPSLRAMCLCMRWLGPSSTQCPSSRF